MKKILRIIFFLIVAGALIILVTNKANTVGSMKKSIHTPQSNSSEITFKGKSNALLEFNLSSSIKEGTLSIILSDSQGNVIEAFETGVTLNKEIHLDKDITYILTVSYENFVGRFNIKVKK